MAAHRIRQLPAALAARGRGAVVLVLPIDLHDRGSMAHSFEVAGCLGIVLRARAPRQEHVA